MDGSARCVIKLMRRFETTGDCRPRKFGGHEKRRLAAHEDKVRALVAAQPDPTITELGQKLTPFEFKVGRSAAHPVLKIVIAAGILGAGGAAMLSGQGKIAGNNAVISTNLVSLLIEGRRRYGKIARIASLARGTILSRTKVYYPARAAGLKQISLSIAYGLR